jgi:hypothetical protein
MFLIPIFRLSSSRHGSPHSDPETARVLPGLDLMSDRFPTRMLLCPLLEIPHQGLRSGFLGFGSGISYRLDV